MRAGNTYQISFDDTGPKFHLWIVASDPDANGLLILVSVTTLRHGKDQTVLLQPGDHPFVRQASVVFFQDARIVSASELQAWIAGNVATAHATCSAHLLKLIQDGLLSSESTPRKVERYFRAQRHSV